MYSQNKLGPHDHIMGQSSHTQKSFLYRSINLYNKLPKNLGKGSKEKKMSKYGL